MKKTILILLVVMSLPGCSTFGRIFPDTRDEYKQAEAMPDLEIPPDLTRDAMTDMMAIPGEGTTTTTAPVATTTPATTVPATAMPTDTTSTVVPTKAQLLMRDGKTVAGFPDELPVAWTRVVEKLTAAGVLINSQDQQKGTLNVTFKDKEGSSWFASMLNMNRSQYVIQMTTTGTTTELVILNETGQWYPTERSDRLLANIVSWYNEPAGQPQ